MKTEDSAVKVEVYTRNCKTKSGDVVHKPIYKSSIVGIPDMLFDLNSFQ